MAIPLIKLDMLGLFDIEGARGYNGLEGSTLDAANITVRPHSLSAPFSVMHGGQLVSGLLLLLNPQNCLTWRCCEADSCKADLANNSLMGSILYIAKSLVARTISITLIIPPRFTQITIPCLSSLLRLHIDRSVRFQALSRSP